MDYNIRKGQTVLIRLDYTVNQEPLADYDADELEFTFGNATRLLSNNGIYYDATEDALCTFLTQEDTLALPTAAAYQLRILKDGEVTPSKIGYELIGDSLSHEILTGSGAAANTVLSVGNEVTI